MGKLLTIAAPVIATSAMLAPGCQPGCGPVPQNTGIVWDSDVDPARENQPFGSQPRFAPDNPNVQVVSRIDMILHVDPAAAGNIAADCAAVIDDEAAASGRPKERTCLYVEWEIDVASTEAGGAAMYDGPLHQPDGDVTAGCCYSGVIPPGTFGEPYGVYFPGGEPGSTVFWSIETPDDGFTTHSYRVPPTASFQRIDWDY